MLVLGSGVLGPWGERGLGSVWGTGVKELRDCWGRKGNRHFSLLNVTAAGACGYDFPCDGERLVRAYLRRRRGTI